jgi:hypothetical protein
MNFDKPPDLMLQQPGDAYLQPVSNDAFDPVFPSFGTLSSRRSGGCNNPGDIKGNICLTSAIDINSGLANHFTTSPER